MLQRCLAAVPILCQPHVVGSAEEEVAELGYLQLIDDRHEPASLCASLLTVQSFVVVLSVVSSFDRVSQSGARGFRSTTIIDLN